MEIIPQIQERNILEGTVVFVSKYKTVNADKKDFDKVTKYMSGFVNLSETGKNSIIFDIDTAMKNEEYIIEIDDDIKITSSCAEGAFRAASTLKQIMSEKSAEKQKIHDYPLIPNRGVMLDISRGRIPKMERFYEIVDVLGDLKYNQLQLYMESFVFDFESFPEYCEGKDPVTKEELKKIKEYCDSKFIRLVPNQNGFGHMASWIEKPELSHLAILRDDDEKPDTLNPFDDGSIELVDKIYSDLLANFDSDCVNIGMDEPFSLGMGQTKELCEKLGKNNVYVDYLNKVIDLTNNKYHMTPMFWDDIVFEDSNCLEKIHPDCIVMDWGYECDMPFSDRCRMLKEKGLRFYTCPGTSSWNSLTGRFDNMIYNIENAAKACIVNGGEGFLLTDWGDGGHPQGFVFSLLPYAYGACCSWNLNITKEIACEIHGTYVKERKIVQSIENYFDRFIFDGEKVSRILHKMANYYTVENNNVFNGTCVMTDSKFLANAKQEFCTIDSVSAKQVINYMNDILLEIEKINKDIRYYDEITIAVKEVILFASFICAYLNKSGKRIINSSLKNEFIELKDEFLSVWKNSSRTPGSEIFIGILDEFIENFE